MNGTPFLSLFGSGYAGLGGLERPVRVEPSPASRGAILCTSGGGSMFRSAGLCGLLFLSCFATPVRAIVTAFSGYSGVVSGASPVVNGVDLDGVVELITNTGIGCSGSLLSDGFSILTAGHCVTSSYGSALPASDT